MIEKEHLWKKTASFITSIGYLNLQFSPWNSTLTYYYVLEEFRLLEPMGLKNAFEMFMVPSSKAVYVSRQSHPMRKKQILKLITISIKCEIREQAQSCFRNFGKMSTVIPGRYVYSPLINSWAGQKRWLLLKIIKICYLNCLLGCCEHTMVLRFVRTLLRAKRDAKPAKQFSSMLFNLSWINEQTIKNVHELILSDRPLL